MQHSDVEVDSGWSRVPIFTILFFDVAALIARSCLEVQLREQGYELNLASDLSFLVVPPILLLLMYPILDKHGQLLLTLFNRQYLTLRILAIGIGLGLALRLAFWGKLVVMTGLGIAVSKDPNIAVGPSFSWACPPGWELTLGILVSAVSIPMIEEIINRGFFLYRLITYGKWFAIALSAILFAVLHNPETIYLAFAVGVVFAIATVNSGALWVSTIAHAIYNLLAQIDWRCLNGYWNPREVTSNTISAGAVGMALMVASLLLACTLISQRIIGPPKAAR